MERSISGLAIRAAEQSHLISTQTSSFLASCLYSCCSLANRHVAHPSSTPDGAPGLAWEAHVQQCVQPSLRTRRALSQLSLGPQEESTSTRSLSQYQASVSASTTHACCTSSSPSSRSRSRGASHVPSRQRRGHGWSSLHTPQSPWGPGCWHSPLPIICSTVCATPSHSAAWGGPCSRALHGSSGMMYADVAAEGSVDSELPAPEVQNLIIEQLQNSFNAGRIKDILKLYDSQFDQWTLVIAMDHMLRLPVDQRRASDLDTKEVMQRLSALYMHLLPDMDPCRSVKLLQGLAQLGVCMHEPGKNQEGFTAVNRHMLQVSEVLLKMDNDQDVINMLWALAKHSHHRELAVDEDLFRYLAQYLVTKVPSLQYRMLSKTAQAYALVGINEWSLLDSICAAAYAKLQSGEFDPAPTINILDALSKLKMENDSFLSVASLKLKANVASLTPANLTTASKALAEMRCDDEVLWRRLMEQATRRMSTLSPSQVVSFTWALNKRNIADVPMHASLAGRAQAILDKFNPSELASLVYLLGKQGLEPKSLMPSLVERAELLMGSMSLRNVSNLVRGFQLLDYGAASSPDKQPEGGEPDPAAQLYAMAAQRAKEWLKDPEGRLVLSVQGTHEEYLDEEMRRVERFRDEHTPDIIERVHYKSGNVVESRLYHVSKKHFKSQNLSDIALALADRGAADPELFSYIAARAKDTMRSFTMMSMVDLVCGFAQAGYYDKETFDELERQFEKTFSEMGPPFLADTMWAFATLNHPLNGNLLKAVMDSSWSRWQRMCSDQQVLARLMWALYTLNADTLVPNHAVFVEFQRLLEEQESQPAGSSPSE